MYHFITKSDGLKQKEFQKYNERIIEYTHLSIFYVADKMENLHLKNLKDQDIKHFELYIKNQLKMGDNMEIIIPGVLEPIKFKIEKLVSVDTGEDIDVVNPGVKDQQVIMNIPVDAEKFYVIRKEI